MAEIHLDFAKPAHWGELGLILILPVAVLLFEARSAILDVVDISTRHQVSINVSSHSLLFCRFTGMALCERCHRKVEETITKLKGV